MCKENQTMVLDFLLLGFQNLGNFKIPLFMLILLIYTGILIGNFLIITLVSIDHRLQVPMFYFLKHLALVDLMFTTNIVPNMLYVILMSGGKISTIGCFFQYCSHSMYVCTQSILLAVMSLDRFMAICQPLRYSSVMTPKLCLYLTFWSWAACAFFSPVEFYLIFTLQFCQSNVIDHFFCDLSSFLDHASINQDLIRWQDFCISVLLIFIPFLLIILSYICIFRTILKISISSRRKKTFSTCSSHLVTVCTHCGVLITVYIFTAIGPFHPENKWKSLLYTVLTPFINPLLYSLRNQEFRNAMRSLTSLEKGTSNK